MRFKKLVARFASNPKQLFLFDSMGGILSAAVPLLILWKFESHFGLPGEVLIAMSITGFLYCAFSLLCALRIKSRWNFFLKILVVANSTYLLALMAYTAINFSDLSQLGLAYLLIDHFVLISVISLELAVIAAISRMWIPGSRS
jgi:hypothetical protein